MAQPIDRGSIDPVDAPVKASVNGGDGLSVVLRAPREFPLSPTNRPSSHANWRDLQVTKPGAANPGQGLLRVSARPSVVCGPHRPRHGRKGWLVVLLEVFASPALVGQASACQSKRSSDVLTRFTSTLFLLLSGNPPQLVVSASEPEFRPGSPFDRDLCLAAKPQNLRCLRALRF